MKSMLFTTDKGLSNHIGHNNCFLNSAVQVFWHLQVFRRNFLSMKHHGCVKGSCIYCALQDIFKEFQSSYTDIIDPDMLRVTLAVAFEDQKKFQLGELNDASECYEKILSRVHFHLTDAFSDDFCSYKHCITHQKFGMSLVEQTICECSATSEPFVFTQLVHYISTSAIIESSQDSKYKNDFSLLLRQASEQQVQAPTCPQGCARKATLVRTLITQPDVVSIGLVWNSESSELSHIQNLMSCIKNEIFLNKLFNCSEMGSSRRELVGVVCYYMKHYSTFFKRTYDGLWISFDDGSVNEIGHEWKKVVDKVCKGRYQPLLLIFQNPDAKPLDISSAPQQNYLIKKNYESFDPYIKDSYMGPPKTLSLHNFNVSNSNSDEKNSNNHNCSDAISLSKIKNEDRSFYNDNFLIKNNLKDDFHRSDHTVCNHLHINNPLFAHPPQQYSTHPKNSSIPKFVNNLRNSSEIESSFENFSKNAFNNNSFYSNNSSNESEITKMKNFTDFSFNSKKNIIQTELQNDVNYNNLNNSIVNPPDTALQPTNADEIPTEKLGEPPIAEKPKKDLCKKENEISPKKLTESCDKYPKPPEKFVFNPPLYFPKNKPQKFQHNDFNLTNDKLKALQLKQKLLNIKIESNKLQQKVIEKRFCKSHLNESKINDDVSFCYPIQNYEHLVNCTKCLHNDFVCNFSSPPLPFTPVKQTCVDNSSKISSVKSSQKTNSQSSSNPLSSIRSSKQNDLENFRNCLNPLSSIRPSQQNNLEYSSNHFSSAISSQHTNIDNYSKILQSSLCSMTSQPPTPSLTNTQNFQAIPSIIFNYSDQGPPLREDVEYVDMCSNTSSFRTKIDLSVIEKLKSKYLCQNFNRQFGFQCQKKDTEAKEGNKTEAKEASKIEAKEASKTEV